MSLTFYRLSILRGRMVSILEARRAWSAYLVDLVSRVLGAANPSNTLWTRSPAKLRVLPVYHDGYKLYWPWVLAVSDYHCR